MSATATRPDRSHAARRWWVVVWLPLLAISAAAVWYVVAVFVPHERGAAIEVWRGRLSAMADDRKAAITAWLDERHGDAKVVAEDPTALYLLSGHRIEPYLFPPEDGPRRNVQRLLDSVQGAYGYRAAYILGAGGNVVVDSTGSPPLEPACRASVARVLSLGHPEVDFHTHESGLPILAITAPVRVADRTVGAVLLSVDPGRWLYPLLLSEPIPTRTGESLLARQIGDQIEFLSPLRHRSAPPLSFRLPFTLPLLAAAAIHGEEGFRSYVDYRGVRVLGAARRIPGTGWGLVVKVDEDEAFSAFRRSVRDVALAWACVLLAVAGVGFGASRTQAASYRAQLSESEARFALLRDHTREGIWFVSRDGVILDANESAAAMHGYTRQEFIGRNTRDFRPPEDPAVMLGLMNGVRRVDGGVFETQHARRDGSVFPIEVSSQVITIHGEEVYLSVYRDITDRKRAEAAVREAEERFRIASETSNDVVYEWDLKQSVRWFGNIDEMLGYGPGEFPRTLDGWAASVHPDDLERVMAAVHAYLEKQVPYTIEYRVRKKDGTYRWWTARGASTRTPDGKPVGWVGTITDITERKKAETTLRESEAKYRTLVESIPQKIFMKDRSFRWVSINEKFAHDFGLRPEEVVGKVDADLFPPELATKYHADDVRILETGKTEELEERYILEGRETWVNTIKTPVRDTNGEIVGVLGVFWDITERKQAEEAVRLAGAYNRSLIEASLDPLVTISSEGKITDVNRATETATGLRRDQLVGTDFSGYFTDPKRARRGYQQVLAEGSVIDYPLTIRHTDGHTIDVLYNASVFGDEAGEVRRVFAAARDITERKRAEEAIKELNAELEERVRQRTAQLEAANKELEAFSHSVSHDLRAPLRAIDGFSRIVMDDYGDRLDDEGKRQLEVIRANTQKMGRLIDDLLAFSRAGRAELRRADVDMKGLVHSVFPELVPTEEGRARIDFVVGELPNAWADGDLIRQVWVNLLSNAVKFSCLRERAVIHVTGALEDDRVVYHVSDNGVGFDMRYADKLFGVFQRLHSSREFEGTGVGLALAQRIVHRHDGEVWGEGTVDDGATFSFALPEERNHEPR
jgi:PAS domain S-box-containing protein